MKSNQRAWVVAVEMGYGHKRAARPLLSIAHGGRIVAADNYAGIPEQDRLVWEKSTKLYHSISRLKDKGFLGKLAFNTFDRLQRIGDVYRRNKETKPTFHAS